MTERRKFLTKVSGAMAVAATATIVDAPNVIAQPKVSGECRRRGLRQWTSSKAQPSGWRPLWRR